MVYTSEIEKLEKRWAENPKGRNFAPLADAYRKAGELDRAVELCKSGLGLHPDYVSAHIVYGRCLIDQKNDKGASDVFRKVLTLDPENVLGLKMLAEIAARGGRYDEAVDWLNQLLAADPMNGDAAELLARAKGKAAQAAAAKPPAPVPAVAVPEPVARLVPPPAPPPPPAASVAPAAAAPTAPMAKPDFEVEHASNAPAAPHLRAQGTPRDIETFDGTLDFDSVAHDAARAEGLEVQEDVQLTPQNLSIEGLAHTQYESGQFAPPPEVLRSEEDELPTIDLPLIMPDDMPEAPPPSAASAPPAAVALSDDDGAADTAALSRAEPVLTETMAELYLRQGHQEDALRVYQALLAQRPGDRRLRARVEALTFGGKREGGRGTGESLQSFLKRILTGRPRAPVSEPVPPPAAVAESPLDSAFSVAPYQPEARPEIAAPGEATRLAEDTISLDSVFGEESPRSSGPSVEPPAHAAPPAPPAPSTPSGAAPQQTGGFSFDQFFSAPPASAPRTPSPVVGGSAGGGEGGLKAPARSSGGGGGGPRPRAAGEDEGDLDQFQAWLRGLKS